MKPLKTEEPEAKKTEEYDQSLCRELVRRSNQQGHPYVTAQVVKWMRGLTPAGRASFSIAVWNAGLQ